MSAKAADYFRKRAFGLGLNDARPDLSGATVGGGEVDRADGKGWVFLAVDTKPDYADTQDHPATATATVWKYRAFYLKDDQKVGQCSAVVEVRVRG